MPSDPPAGLAGKVALVTGAASGIGAAIADEFVRQGANVVLADVETEALARKAETLAAEGLRVLACSCDVRDASQTKAAVEAAIESFGGLDVLVNNAGVVRYGLLPDLSEADWDYVLDVNLKGMYQTCRFAIPELRARGGGAIINLASIQAYWSRKGTVAYSASKAGVVAFTRALALDHAHEGITVNAIAPGRVRTPMLGAAAVEVAGSESEAGSVARIIEPQEIADFAVFLASDKAKAMTGTTIVVDGGMTAGSME